MMWHLFAHREHVRGVPLKSDSDYRDRMATKDVHFREALCSSLTALSYASSRPRTRRTMSLLKLMQMKAAPMG